MASGLLGMIGTGLSLFGGIEGLIQGANEQHQAEVAAQEAITQFQATSNEQYLNLLSGGTSTLETLSGGLNNALVSGGKSLGAALAGAGVYNSTATAGAIANQAAANASTEGQYSTQLANTLATQKNQAGEEASQMQYGLALNNLNFARQQTQGSQSGLAQFFGNLGQMNFGNLFGKNPNPSNQSAPGAANPAVMPTNGIVTPTNYGYTPQYSGNYPVSAMYPGANY